MNRFYPPSAAVCPRAISRITAAVVLIVVQQVDRADKKASSKRVRQHERGSNELADATGGGGQSVTATLVNGSLRAIAGAKSECWHNSSVRTSELVSSLVGHDIQSERCASGTQRRGRGDS